MAGICFITVQNQVKKEKIFEKLLKIWNNSALPNPYIAEGLFTGGAPHGRETNRSPGIQSSAMSL